MSNTFSYSDYKDSGELQNINKFMNSTIGGTKGKPFYGNIDNINNLKQGNENQYAGSRVARSSNIPTLNKTSSNKT